MKKQKKKPLLKRLKYKNILILLVSVAVLVSVVLLIKKAAKTVGNNTADSSSVSSKSDSSQDSDSSDDSKIDSPNTDGVLGKIDFQYKKFSDAQISEGTLALISPNYVFGGITPTDCVSCYDYMYNENRDKLFSIKSSDVKARVAVLEAVNKMMCEFYKTYGTANMVLMSGYSGSDKGSDLATGYSVDFSLLNSDGSYSKFNAVGSYQWIAQNAYKYGLILRYPELESANTGVTGETGIMRYVGQPHSQIMSKNDMCLEEYLAYIKNHNYENAVGYTTDDGSNYAIY